MCKYCEDGTNKGLYVEYPCWTSKENNDDDTETFFCSYLCQTIEGAWIIMNYTLENEKIVQHSIGGTVDFCPKCRRKLD